MGNVFFGKIGATPKRMLPEETGIQRLGGSLTVETQHYEELGEGGRHFAFFTFGSGEEHGEGGSVFTLESGREKQAKVGEVDYYMGHGIERG